MKLLTKEQEEAHYRTTVQNAIGGGILGLAVGVAGVYGASWRYPVFRHLTLPFKAFLITSAGTFTSIIMADRASRAFEISHNPEERYQQQASKERAALAKQQPVSQRLLAWGREYRYPIVGASWLLSMGLAFAIVGRSPYLTTSQKIVQARVYAQGLTLAVLIGTAAFEISDRDKDDDSSDSEHQNPATHHKSYKGEDQWKDMVETEERKIKERDQEIKAQEERDLKAIHKHKTHKNHHHEDHK